MGCDPLSGTCDGPARAPSRIPGSLVGLPDHARLLARSAHCRNIVELFPGKTGLLHISEIADKRLATVEEVLKVGDMTPVKVKERTDKGLSLSRKQALKEQQAQGQ
jgi:transcriptional accessory protein Tex/SPT6